MKAENLNVYVFAGKDEALVSRECEELIKKLVPVEQRTTGLLKVDADRITVSEVLDELRTLPFLTDRRVVVLSQAEKFISENRDILENYLDKPAPTAVLILTVSNLDSRTKFAKKLTQKGKLVNISSPKTSELPAILKDYALNTHGKKLAADAAHLLVEMLGDELAQIYSEIDKLAVFSDNNENITSEHVNSLTGHNRRYNLFDVINSVIMNDTAGALYQLRRVFDQDRSCEYTFVGAMAYHLRRMFSAKVMILQGINQWQVSKQLRIWYGRESFFASLSKASLEKIGYLICELARLDYNIKTGQKNVHAAAEELILRLSAA